MDVVVVVAQVNWYHLTVAQDGTPVDVGHKLIGVPLLQDGDVITVKPGPKFVAAATSEVDAGGFSSEGPKDAAEPLYGPIRMNEDSDSGRVGGDDVAS